MCRDRAEREPADAELEFFRPEEFDKALANQTHVVSEKNRKSVASGLIIQNGANIHSARFATPPEMRTPDTSTRGEGLLSALMTKTRQPWCNILDPADESGDVLR